MNGDNKKVAEIVGFLNSGNLSPDTEVVVAPTALYVPWVIANVKNNVMVSVQNCHQKTSGAFTGEISAEMALDIGCKWVILGHSERRNIFGETDELIAEKVKHCMDTKIGVIACIGETLDQREANTTMDVVARQLKAISGAVTDWSRVVIAYEPVWAIGTGKVATPEQAQDVHDGIRKWLVTNVNQEVSIKTRIIYGGSVNAKNCQELAKKPDVDGFLVGGASLKEEFITIINARL